MHTYRYLILGGGMVAGYAARAFVEGGARHGALGIISADADLPYERPPLSKGFLTGAEPESALPINDRAFYDAHGIALHLGVAVTQLDLRRKLLLGDAGEEFAYEKLLIATGARPRHLDVPGADLNGVHYLRSLADARRLRTALTGARRAVVLGGGFIGVETAASLARSDVETTLLFPERRLWQRLLTPRASAFFAAYLAARGVTVLSQDRAAAIQGDSRVTGVLTEHGGRIPADIVLAGIGATPATDALAGSGLALGDGVLVNEYLETIEADVYAAGDVARYPDLIFGGQRRVEHWDNAVAQGEHAARVMIGERLPYRRVPYFFSDIFDLSFEYWGDATGATETVHRGDVEGGSFSVWWLRDGHLVAALALNRPDEERELAPAWIESGQRLSAERLAHESLPLAEAAATEAAVR